MNYEAWISTVEGVSCISRLMHHGVPSAVADRVLRACYTSGELSGRCEGMSEALETAVRASADSRTNQFPSEAK